jgi:hypothetical protein
MPGKLPIDLIRKALNNKTKTPYQILRISQLWLCCVKGMEVGLRSNSSAPAVWQFLAAPDKLNAFGQRRGYAISTSGEL